VKYNNTNTKSANVVGSNKGNGTPTNHGLL
jgi:hypothetical protein